MSLIFNPSIYAFSWYSVPLLLVAVVLLAIGIFVLKQHTASRTNLTFFFLTIVLFIWLTGYAWMYSTTNASLALQVYRKYTFLGVVLIGINVYVFSVTWLRLWNPQKLLVFLGYLSALSFYMLAATGRAVVPFVDKYFWGFYSRYDLAGALFFGSFVFFFFAAFFNFIYRLKHPLPDIQKSQIKAVLIAFCFAITG